MTSSMRAVASELIWLSPEVIDDKTNPKADAVQHNCELLKNSYIPPEALPPTAGPSTGSGNGVPADSRRCSPPSSTFATAR